MPVLRFSEKCLLREYYASISMLVQLSSTPNKTVEKELKSALFRLALDAESYPGLLGGPRWPNSRVTTIRAKSSLEL
jgi:hypothetical protein